VDKQDFGRKLNALRREKQISSERLSEMCGVNAVFIRQIENATRLPSLPVFVRICNSLQVSPSYFLADSLIWNEEDSIAMLGQKLRELPPRHFSTVMETVKTLIEGLSGQASSD